MFSFGGIFVFFRNKYIVQTNTLRARTCSFLFAFFSHGLVCFRHKYIVNLKMCACLLLVFFFSFSEEIHRADEHIARVHALFVLFGRFGMVSAEIHREQENVCASSFGVFFSFCGRNTSCRRTHCARTCSFFFAFLSVGLVW